ncbi:hypothetical protein NONI108955_10865 [Nocardia ninae]|nr:hypothetical protein [Nocardia ninae]
MPAHLGDRVRTHLLRRKTPEVPITLHPQSRRWMFLVQPDIAPDDTQLFYDLFHLNVSLVPPGAAITLPSPIEATRDLPHWVTAPCNDFRPSGVLVLDALSACTGAKLGRSFDTVAAR